ncbi:MAG: Lrp/AsnC family transcriptional regulator [Candidatus Woesearchaeota archaeon]
MAKLDENDIKLLRLIQEDSKLSIQELSKETGLPPTTVHNRTKRMEKEGIIRKYTAEINWSKAGRQVLAYVLVSVEYILPTGGRVQQEDAAKEIRGMEGVEEVSILTGGADLLVKVRAKDLGELNEFVVRKLRNVQGVDKTQTMIVLSSY